MEFMELNLDEKLKKGIQAAGYVECTPVQEQVIQASKNESEKGPDLYVQSQTGTGKTAAYLIAIINQMLQEKNAGKKCLVLVPTRELAVQVEEEAKVLVADSGLKPFSVYGGVGYEKQIANLKKGVDILIGTPGRVIDLIEGKNLEEIADILGFRTHSAIHKRIKRIQQQYLDFDPDFRKEYYKKYKNKKVS